MCIQNLKSVALPNPEIIGGTQKSGQSLDIPTLLLENFQWALVRMHPMSVPATLEVRSSWVNRGYPKFGAVPGYAHKRGGRGGRGWYRSKERW